MKKILSLLIALSFCLVSFGQWTNQTSGTTEDLNAIQFLNTNTGYAIGDYGTILKTLDSGSNWTTLDSNVTIPLNSLFFIDNDIGFVSGSHYNSITSSIEGVLLKTIDGGVNWINLNFPFEESLSDIFFINSNVGFASTSSDGLFKTVDGGINWNLVKTTNTRKVFFSSLSIGYSIDIHPNGNAISKTIDGGDTWLQIKDDSSPDYTSSNILTSLFFTSETNGFFGSPYYGGIYSTSDGGENLNYIDTSIISLNFPSSNIGYAITEFNGTKISQTNDGGLNWNTIYENDTSLNDIFFINNSSGWVVGKEGTILHNNNLTLGIDSIKNLDNQIFIYPNPSDNLITINLDNNLTISKMLLYNNIGQLLLETKSEEKVINLDKYPQGVYILKIETTKGLISKQIIKRCRVGKGESHP